MSIVKYSFSTLNGTASSMSSSPFMPTSWSDLPLDLLLSIKDKIYERSDLISFRSVCAQWRSSIPASTPLPCYSIQINYKYNTIEFTIDNNKNNHLISLPSPFQHSPIDFVCSSNGWLVLGTNCYEIIHPFDPVTNLDIIFPCNKILYLFDPVSNLKLVFPQLPPMLLRRYRKLKQIVYNTLCLFISKVVVSSCAGGGVAVAGIIHIKTQTNSYHDKRLVFCRYGKRPKWSLLMEESRSILDIAVAGDDHFYAIGEDWELYMVVESPTMIRLKKFELLLPEHILGPHLEDEPVDKEAHFVCSSMEESGESNLMIYGRYWRHRLARRMISLKLDVTKLHGSSNNVIVACEAEWIPHLEFIDPCDQYFVPSLRERSLKLS